MNKTYIYPVRAAIGIMLLLLAGLIHLNFGFLSQQAKDTDPTLLFVAGIVLVGLSVENPIVIGK